MRLKLSLLLLALVLLLSCQEAEARRRQRGAKLSRSAHHRSKRTIGDIINWKLNFIQSILGSIGGLFGGGKPAGKPSYGPPKQPQRPQRPQYNAPRPNSGGQRPPSRPQYNGRPNAGGQRPPARPQNRPQARPQGPPRRPQSQPQFGPSNAIKMLPAPNLATGRPPVSCWWFPNMRHFCYIFHEPSHLKRVKLLTLLWMIITMMRMTWLLLLLLTQNPNLIMPRKTVSGIWLWTNTSAGLMIYQSGAHEFRIYHRESFNLEFIGTAFRQRNILLIFSLNFSQPPVIFSWSLRSGDKAWEWEETWWDVMRPCSCTSYPISLLSFPQQ